MENSKNDYKNRVLKNEILSKYNWFNLGGPAKILFKPVDSKELSNFLKDLNDKKIYILGAGSNTLIRDGGINGVVVKLSSKFSYINLLNDNIIEVGAATLDRQISDFGSKNSLSGLEFLSCIPGSIGGGIKMNSGCYGDDISKILLSIKVMDYDGNLKEINKDQIKFYYRGSDIPDNLIILSAKLQCSNSSQELIEEKKNQFIKQKKDTQPSRIKTCGSTFKNPSNHKAWKLIKKSSCENMQVGDAKISEKHSNFFVNNGKASSQDIEKLIKKVKDKVKEDTGINLELEIKVIGENK